MVGDVAIVDELKERVAILEKTVQEHSKLHEKQNDKNDILIEMKTLLRMQTEINTEQKDQMKAFGITLNKVNDNLTHLNSKQALLDERVNGIEETLQSQKIDPIKLFKSVLSYIVTGISSIVISYLIYKLGIKN